MAGRLSCYHRRVHWLSACTTAMAVGKYYQAQRQYLREIKPNVVFSTRKIATRTKLAEEQDWICSICGNTMAHDDVSLDHIRPLCQGGDAFDERNLQVVHPICNANKGGSWDGKRGYP